MKLKSTLIPSLLVLLALFSIPAWGQDPAPGTAPTPAAASVATPAELAAAKLETKWTKALEEARRDFQNSNDRESAEFVTKMLDSFERPEGMSPAALESNLNKMRSRVRDLVRRGALESITT